jgi:hypothetical protein
VIGVDPFTLHGLRLARQPGGAVRDDEGRPRFWQGVTIDVTAHRELESRFRDLASTNSSELRIDAD